MIDENELNLIDEEEASGLSWARVEVHRDKSHWIPFRSFEARFESLSQNIFYTGETGYKTCIFTSFSYTILTLLG